MPQLTEYEQMQRDYWTEQRLSIGADNMPDPDMAERVLAVAANTGMPYDLIESNIDELEAEVKRGGFDPDQWMRDSPRFAEFAAENPYHLAVLKQDEENLGKWERAWRPVELGWRSTWAQVETMLIYSRHADGDIREGDDEMLAEYEKLLQPHDFGAENPFIKPFVWTAKHLGPMLYVIGQAGDEMLMGTSMGMLTGGLMGTAAGGVGAVPGIIAGGGVGMAVGFQTGLAMGGYELMKGEAYQRMIESGLSRENAAIAAKASGAVAAGFEALGIWKFVRAIPVVEKITSNAAQTIAEKLTGQILMDRTVARQFAKFGVRYGQLMGIEMATEIAQDSAMTVAQNIVAAVEKNPDAMISWDQYVDQVKETAIETAKAVVLISGIGPGLNLPGDMLRARDAQRMKSVYKALGEASKDSKLRKNLPDKYREFVERVTKDGAVQNLLIDIDRFTEYFQEQGMDAEKVAADLGIVSDKPGKPSSLKEAATLGTDLEIPVKVYADKIAATVHHDALSLDIKSRSDQMTAREAQIFYQNADELQRAQIDQAPPEGHVPVQEILDIVRNQLIAADTEYSAAEKQAALTEHAFSVLARRNGMEPMELFNKYWGGVQRDVPEILQRADVDIFIDPLIDRLRAGDIPTQADIFGEGLSDFLKSKGGLIDQGGELAARDVAKQIRGLVKKGGLTFDAAAELAAEAGFIAEYDTDQLLAALDQELRGEPVFGRGADPEQASLAKQLDDLGDLIEQAGIDLATATNAEVRAALTGEMTLDQDDIIEIPGVLPDNIELAQDFAGIEIEVDIELAGRPGEFVGISQPAQTAFDNATARFRGMQNLLECING